MLDSGTDPESYITEHTCVCKEKRSAHPAEAEREGGAALDERENTSEQKPVGTIPPLVVA